MAYCVKWILDCVFVDDIELFSVCRTSPLTQPEDIYHPSLEITVHLPKKNLTSVETIRTFETDYNFKRTNLNVLRTLFCSTNCANVLDSPLTCTRANINQLVSKFYYILLHFFDLTVPKTRRQISNEAPWFSDGLRRLRNKKTKLYKRYKKFCKSTDLSAYLSMRYKYSRLCKLAYKQYISNLLNNLRFNSKSSWKFVNMKRKSRVLPTEMCYNDTVSCDNSVITNLFADFFASTYSTEIFSDLSYPYNIPTYDIADPIIDENTVLVTMKALKPSFASGPDKIPAFILKTFCDILSAPVTYMFNVSFQSGCFLNLW